MRWIATALAAGCLLVSAPAQAADPPSAPPSPRQVELANEIMDATGVAANYDVMLRNMFSGMIARSGVTTGTPESRAAADAMLDRVTTAVLKLKPRLLEMSAQIYAQTFTEEELAQILAFYRSPVGQSMARKMPDGASAISPQNCCPR